MTVVYTRTGTPMGGKQSEALAYFRARAAAIKKNYGVEPEVKVRAGGPVGQVIMISRMKDLAEFEATKRRVIADTAEGKIPTAPDGVFASGEDALWLEL
ncbi:hypothetical protein RD110_16725 [Rhodoferax koreense]|uniref:Uncharacterized protein n=1 Tax=Rhodoferax koreensis TaxID=1842727 RepID=A0A1P8JXZ9_9BURK|nr:hypothetical protein [Rhodoferax koreense]APW38639.1 hypothetical protein RD110_16725 [Rhodoferax koreense]